MTLRYDTDILLIMFDYFYFSYFIYTQVVEFKKVDSKIIKNKLLIYYNHFNYKCISRPKVFLKKNEIKHMKFKFFKDFKKLSFYVKLSNRIKKRISNKILSFFKHKFNKRLKKKIFDFNSKKKFFVKKYKKHIKKKIKKIKLKFF